MKVWAALSKINDIRRYPQRRKRTKLYRQWVERAGLPPEAVPAETGKSEDVSLQVHGPEAHEPLRVQVEPDRRVAAHPEVTGDMMTEINKRQLRLPMLYMLLGASLVILLAGLILLLVYCC